MRLLPYGDTALLVELDDGDQVAALRAALTDTTGNTDTTSNTDTTGTTGVEELVPAARTLLVSFNPAKVSGSQLRTAIDAAAERARAAGPSAAADQPLVVVPVRYDGADLDYAAEYTGWSVGEVIARHLAGAYTVAFCGFAPGFAYLTGLDPGLRLPRRDTPRTHVPAGAVGIAGEYTAAYPRSSPGGWRLLGRTDAVLWDPSRPQPALLSPGTRVRFEAG
jgi:5-oxoprolinase (ATP-hydrolysing) subunit B